MSRAVGGWPSQARTTTEPWRTRRRLITALPPLIDVLADTVQNHLAPIQAPTALIAQNRLDEVLRASRTRASSYRRGGDNHDQVTQFRPDRIRPRVATAANRPATLVGAGRVRRRRRQCQRGDLAVRRPRAQGQHRRGGARWRWAGVAAALRHLFVARLGLRAHRRLRPRPVVGYDRCTLGVLDAARRHPGTPQPGCGHRRGGGGPDREPLPERRTERRWGEPVHP